jgi:addiction module HigA family antidote
MMTYPAKFDPNRCPSHPGGLLREALESISLNKAAVAELLGISRQHLYDLTAERKPISPIRIGKLFGNGPGIWLRMQVAYDLWHAERETDVSSIKTIGGCAP